MFKTKENTYIRKQKHRNKDLRKKEMNKNLRKKENSNRFLFYTDRFCVRDKRFVTKGILW